jgi:hypothetical protein
MWYEPYSTVDGYLRVLVVTVLVGWLLFTGMLLENPYPQSLVDGYALPITRILLLALVLLSAAWCPTVGVIMALSYVSLGADVLVFTKST